MTMTAPRSVLDALTLHEQLVELFLDHQDALLSVDVPTALARLDRYERLLLDHMRVEEDRWLPLYAERAGRPPGGPIELFLGEHRKMRAFLERFRETLGRIASEDEKMARRSVLALFDRQAMYKHLVEHHDLREKNVLYPWLDRVTSADERAALLADESERQPRSAA